jgi:hypothetical protein
LQYLKPRLEAAQKRETDEMLGKLKGLGNSILGSRLDGTLTDLETDISMQGISVCPLTTSNLNQMDLEDIL